MSDPVSDAWGPSIGPERPVAEFSLPASALQPFSGGVGAPHGEGRAVRLCVL
jgi:hypothetical protein